MATEAINHAEGMSLAKRPTGVLLGLLFVVAVWFLRQFIPAVIRGVLFGGVMPELGAFLLTLAGYGFTFLFMWLWLRFKEKRSFRSIGFPKTSQIGKQIWVGGLAGIAAAISVVGLAAGIGAVTVRVTPAGMSGGLFALALLLLLGFTVQGTAEEVLYRGYALQLFRKPLGLMGAIGAQAALFMLAHGSFALLSVINLILSAVFFAFWALADNGLWGVSAFHVLWNWMLGIVFGGTTSGHTFPGAILQTEPTAASPLLSGGQFGLEGSLITTGLFALLWFLTYRSFRRSRQRAELTVAKPH